MKTTVKTVLLCPSCRKPIPAGALAGLCPACLLAQGTDSDDGSRSGRFEPLPIPDVARLFPQLEILDLLGAGGMGAVYKARQPALDRIVALKILPAGGPGGANFAERFNREARALARLNHPNIVAVYEFGQAGGLHYFLMEYVDGANLRLLEQGSRLSPREALQIIPQICDALQYAHDEGVVHRDIKPENVLVDRKGRVKIADFGLAKILGIEAGASRLTADGQVMGTPHYMAPEQIERPLAVDHRADIYSLGVVLYEMLTGDLPLGKFAPPSKKVRVDVRFDEIVLRALENDPSRRYQRASEVKTGVETIPLEAAPATQPTAVIRGDQYLGWMGFAVVRDRDGARTIHWTGTAAGFGVTFGLLSLAFAFVTVFSGGSLFGWIGIKGWPSVAARLLISGVVMAFGVVQAKRSKQSGEWVAKAPESTLILPSAGRPWAIGRKLVSASLAVLVWSFFQTHWLMPWLRSKSGGGRVVEVATQDARSGSLVAKLPGSGVIELLALADASSAADRWWRPDGSMVTNSTLSVEGPADTISPSARKTFLAFRVAGLPRDGSAPIYDFGDGANVSAGGSVSENGTRIAGGWPVRVAWATLRPMATIRLGYGLGGWRTIAIHTPGRGASQYLAEAGDPKWTASINHVSDDGRDTFLTLVMDSDRTTWNMRLIAVDMGGAEHLPGRSMETPGEKTATWTHTFEGLTRDRIREFRVQVQRVHWVEFRDVALQANMRQLNSSATAPLESPSDQVAARAPETGALGADLPDGGRVELLVIGQPDAAPDGWWKPDGSLAENATYQVRDVCPVLSEGARPLDFIFRLPAAADGKAAAQFDFGSAAQTGAGGEAWSDGVILSGGWPLQIAWPTNLTSATFRVGFGQGEWKTLSRHEPLSTSTIWNRERGNPDLGLALHSAVDSPDGLQAIFVFEKPDRNWKLSVVAVDTNGTEHGSTSSSGSTRAGAHLWTYQFSSLPVAAVREIRVLAQRIHWVQFRQVALFPTRPVPPPRPARFGLPTDIRFTELLDLDNGRLGGFPQNHGTRNLADGLGENIAWMQQNGFDAEARADTIGLLGTRIVYLDDRDWDGITPARLSYLLGDERRMPSELRPPFSRLPVTVGFRTREGTTGILQVLGYGGDRPGATVRLKRITR